MPNISLQVLDIISNIDDLHDEAILKKEIENNLYTDEIQRLLYKMSEGAFYE